MMEYTPQERMQRDADTLYDLTEGLADCVSKLGAKAVSEALLERLQDARAVLSDAIGELETLTLAEETPTEPTPIAPIAPEEVPPINETLEPTVDDEPIDLESDEARDIVRRYFVTNLGNPAAWEVVGEHLLKNGVIVPPRRKLNSVIKSWMPEIEQDIATIHNIQIRWLNFNGSWVAAEVARQTPAAAPVTQANQNARETQTPEPASAPTTPAPTTPVPTTPKTTPKEVLPVEQEYVPALPLEAVSAKIIELPPRGEDYTRFNTLRNKLDLSETAATQLLDHLCEIGALTTFRFGGSRQITADHSLARHLDTKPIKQGEKREQHTTEEAPFTDYVSAAMITDAFLQPRMHIEQAMTYREIMAATGYAESTVKDAVKFLKALDILKTDLRFLSRSGHRSGSQQVQKVTLASQSLKNELKSLGFSGLLEYITTRATDEQTDDSTIVAV